MADSKISALPASTTPLAGTEVLPIVQSGTTKQVSVANLTAGRAVQAASSTLSSNAALNWAAFGTSTAAQVVGAQNTLGSSLLVNTPSVSSLYASGFGVDGAYASTVSTVKVYALGVKDPGYTSKMTFYTSDSGTLVETGTFGSNGNLSFPAAKGVNFTANTPAAGMTSQLLNWYEEGTWTPNQGAGLTVVGAFSSSGTYTRIGRQVTVRGQVVGATSVAIAASASQICTNLPYASSGGNSGTMFNDSLNASGGVASSAQIVYAVSTMTATPSITFTITYQI